MNPHVLIISALTEGQSLFLLHPYSIHLVPEVKLNPRHSISKKFLNWSVCNHFCTTAIHLPKSNQSDFTYIKYTYISHNATSLLKTLQRFPFVLNK